MHFCVGVLGLVHQVLIFQGSEHHRRIAPSAPRVGPTEAANAIPQFAVLTREHLLHEGHTDNEDEISLTGKPVFASGADWFNQYTWNTLLPMTSPLIIF